MPHYYKMSTLTQKWCLTKIKVSLNLKQHLAQKMLFGYFYFLHSFDRDKFTSLTWVFLITGVFFSEKSGSSTSSLVLEHLPQHLKKLDSRQST